ncbi:MAG TPA: hypothetical protein VG944_03000 [Fimbriimonas sp.]|nr:hypothetical protein [Fimbriimonas sp.]
MKSIRACLCGVLLGLVCVAGAQTPKHRSAVDMVKDVTSLFATHFPSKAALQQKANQIARLYQDSLKSIGKQVDKISTEAATKLDGMDLRSKLGVAMELWRVRSSIDLLSLTDPDTFHALTGMTIPDLRDLNKRFIKAETQLEAMLPWRI